MREWSQGRILVTGGAGLIGSAVVWALNRMGYENILVTDMLGSSEKFKNLIPLRFDDYIEGDLFLDALTKRESLFSDIHCILHLGANSATTEKDCRHLVENNYDYTKSLCEWALSRGARFVYASSAATYGDGTQGMDDQNTDALPSLRPLNMYGYSKHLFDLHALRHGYLNEIVGLKYFNVFGPNEHHKGDMRSVVHKACSQILETGKVKLFRSYHPDYRDGEQKRDFLYVKDAVAMTLHLAATPEAGGLYNLGSGKAQTWLDLVKPIFQALGKEPEIEFIDMPESLKPKYQYYTCAAIEKLHNSGYDAEVTPLSEAVHDYVKNYLVPGNYLGDEASA